MTTTHDPRTVPHGLALDMIARAWRLLLAADAVDHDDDGMAEDAYLQGRNRAADELGVTGGWLTNHLIAASDFMVTMRPREEGEPQRTFDHTVAVLVLRQWWTWANGGLVL